MKFWGKVGEVIKMGIKSDLAYIMSTWAGVFVSFMQIVIFYYIWSAVYGDNSSLHGIEKTQMITYVILSRVIFMMVMWGGNLWVSNLIQTGQISVELLRPIDFQAMIYLFRMSSFISTSIFNGIPIMLVTGLMFKLVMPISLYHGLLFALSLFMAMTISFLLEFSIGTLAFYTSNGWGLHILKEAVVSLLAGALVPLVFFPSWLRTIVEALPLKDMVYTPIALYLGILPGQQIPRALMTQFIWVVVLMVLSRLFYKISIRKVTVHGG